MAFLVDSVSKAAKGNRTLPDWWQERRRGELDSPDAAAASKEVFEQIRGELFGGAESGSTPSITQDGFASVSAIIRSNSSDQ